MTNPDSRAMLLALAEQRGTSLAALSALIGRNTTYLQQFIRKGSPRKLAEADRHTLARFFGVSEAMLGSTAENPRTAIGNISDWLDVPRLSLDASAGPGATALEEQAIGTLRFSARWLRSMGLDPDCLSAIVVAGDSMEPTLRDGDEILVECKKGPFREGVHVLRVDDVLLVKRLAHARPGQITVISDNPAYQPQTLPQDALEVIGRVVWKGGRL